MDEKTKGIRQGKGTAKQARGGRTDKPAAAQSGREWDAAKGSESAVFGRAEKLELDQRISDQDKTWKFGVRR